jgi:hypothetical protein
MRYVAKPAAPPKRRRSRKKSSRAENPAEFVRRTFYYIKGEQLLQVSNRLLCDAV